MKYRTIATFTFAGLAGIGLANSALAGKKNDTLRIGFYDPISTVDITFDPKPETGLSSYAVFDSLLAWDEVRKKFQPSLAKAWKRTSPTTFEFDLRDDIKFHDGSEFDADDVVYSINWLANPKVKFRIKSRFLWIKAAEKLGKYKVRVTAKRPTVAGLMRLAKSTPIFPSDVHGATNPKSTFGRKAIGTGPYKVEFVDPNKGVSLIRNPDYKHGGDWKPAGSIGKIQLVPIPDAQTQIAQLITGGIDMMYRAPKDQVDSLRADPRFKITVQKGQLYMYMGLDAINRSGNKALSDVRVRRALMMAVNRQGIKDNLIAGGKGVPLMKGMCFEFQRGCSVGDGPPAYDPAAAKKLLAEAGYPNGFETEITTTLPPVYAEAVAGDLRKIGVKAKVAKLTFGAYRKKQRTGKVQILVNPWASGGLPDVQPTVSFFFAKSGRNYWNDKLIAGKLVSGEKLDDDKARRAEYKKAFDQINAQAYILPLTPWPPVFIHTKDVRIDTGALETIGAAVWGFKWN